MELEADTAALYADHAFAQMLAVAERLREPKINTRPFGPDTNGVAALIVHCCGVVEFWIGHVAIGRPSTRDRESEFSQTATLDELRSLVTRTSSTLRRDLQRLDAGDVRSENDVIRKFMDVPDQSDAAVVMHVVEELYQHLGHIEVTADALTRR